MKSAVAAIKKRKEYLPSLIDGRPDKVKAKIVVQVLQKAGSLQLDKELEGAKMECAMDKLAKSIIMRQGNQLATLTDLQESSKAREIDNGKTWANEFTKAVLRKEDSEIYTEFNFWNNLMGKEISQVFRTIHSAMFREGVVKRSPRQMQSG
jgi:hypothetical protein